MSAEYNRIIRKIPNRGTDDNPLYLIKDVLLELGYANSTSKALVKKYHSSLSPNNRREIPRKTRITRATTLEGVHEIIAESKRLRAIKALNKNRKPVKEVPQKSKQNAGHIEPICKRQSGYILDLRNRLIECNNDRNKSSAFYI